MAKDQQQGIQQASAPSVHASQIQENDFDLKSEATDRILSLQRMLTANACTRKEIFAVLGTYYKLDQVDEESSTAKARQRAGKMLERDLTFLEEVLGYELCREYTGLRTIRYSLVKGTGPKTPFLLRQSEVEALAVLYTLFADPASYAHTDGNWPLPTAPRPPFAAEVMELIERLAATLPDEQRQQFQQSIHQPFVYFNFTLLTDYVPYRSILDTLIRAITHERQVRFLYTPSGRQQPTLHEWVDPYYVAHIDGHLYLIGFSYKMNQFYEYRIDRILAEGLAVKDTRLDKERRRHPITFTYWIDAGLLRGGGLSQRWLTQTVEREEKVQGASGKIRHRFLIQATAYSEWRILQQLRKYADGVELVEPPSLREQMRQDIERMYHLYHQ